MTKAQTATTRPDDDPLEEWRAERQAGRVGSLTDRMPPVHAHPGDMAPEVTAWVQAMIRGDRPNLLLLGATGCGKTWHAWHAALQALEGGWDGSVLVLSADEFRARTAPRDKGSVLDDIIRMALADLLILDDVGAHRTTDWWLESLYAVVNRRYEQLLPTVITSNVADLRAELGERIASRLAAGAVMVVLDGPDRRRP